MRPVDLAREHGLSTQAVRNYERDGILPVANRSSNGYRSYGPQHAQALRAFLALVPGHGRDAAAAILRTLNAGNLDRALALVDAGHARLAQDRVTLDEVEAALHGPALGGPALGVVALPARTGSLPIGALAHRLGLRPATLRKWERAGLLAPRRDRGHRVYDAADVRDAHLVHQLRRGGYLLRQIAPVVVQVREAGGVAALESTLAGWRDRLAGRGLAMLSAAGEVARYVALVPGMSSRISMSSGSGSGAPSRSDDHVGPQDQKGAGSPSVAGSVAVQS